MKGYKTILAISAILCSITISHAVNDSHMKYLPENSESEILINNTQLISIINDTRNYIKEQLKSSSLYCRDTYKEFRQILEDLYSKMGKLDFDGSNIQNIINEYSCGIQKIKDIQKEELTRQNTSILNSYKDYLFNDDYCDSEAAKRLISNADNVILEFNKVINKLKKFISINPELGDYPENL